MTRDTATEAGLGESTDLFGHTVGAPQNNGVCHSLGTMATEFGKTRDVLRRVLSEAGVAPTSERSGHPLYRLRDVYLAVTGEQDSDQLNPHARHAQAKAILAEDEIKTRRGELLEAFEVERAFAALFKQVTQGFDTAVDTLERDVGLSPSQADRLEQHFDQCREQMYRDVTDDEKGREKAVPENDGRPRKNVPGTDRGSKNTKRIRRARSGKRRNKKTN